MQYTGRVDGSDEGGSPGEGEGEAGDEGEGGGEGGDEGEGGGGQSVVAQDAGEVEGGMTACRLQIVKHAKMHAKRELCI